MCQPLHCSRAFHIFSNSVFFQRKKFSSILFLKKWKKNTKRYCKFSILDKFVDLYSLILFFFINFIWIFFFFHHHSPYSIVLIFYKFYFLILTRNRKFGDWWLSTFLLPLHLIYYEFEYKFGVEYKTVMFQLILKIWTRIQNYHVSHIITIILILFYVLTWKNKNVPLTRWMNDKI